MVFSLSFDEVSVAVFRSQTQSVINSWKGIDQNQPSSLLIKTAGEDKGLFNFSVTLYSNISFTIKKISCLVKGSLRGVCRIGIEFPVFILCWAKSVLPVIFSLTKMQSFSKNDVSNLILELSKTS